MLRSSEYCSCLLRHMTASEVPLPGNSSSHREVTESTSNSVPYASKTRAFMGGSYRDSGSGIRDPANSVESYVLEVDRLGMDAAARRRDPVRELARLDDAPLHHRLDERVVAGARHPLVAARVPGGLGHHLAVRADVVARVIADLAMEALVRQREPERDAVLLDHLAPPVAARLQPPDVVVA